MENTGNQELLYTRIGDELANQGYALVDEFLSPEFQNSLRGEITGLLDQGGMKVAGIGNSDAKVIERSIRGDQIYWLEEGEENGDTPAGLKFLEQIHGVREFLRRYLMLPLRGIESHYAVYPKGTYYKRHLDQFQGESHRKLSFICYLNQNWEPGDGGELMIYHEEEDEIRVNPLGGRLVIFRSDLLEHEVLITQAQRIGITGWMLDCEPGLRFLNS